MSKSTKKYTLSKYCANIRAKTGLNKKAFAKSVGVSDVQIGKIERGIFDNPSPLMLFRIFKTYQIDSSKISDIELGNVSKEFIYSFNQYIEQDELDSNVYYLQQHFSDYLLANHYTIIEPSWCIKDPTNKEFPKIVPHTEYIDALDIGGHKQNKYIYGYIIKSVSTIKSEANKDFVREEIHSAISNIVNPLYLRYPSFSTSFNLKPGENGNKFDLYFITGSKEIYNYLLELKNTFILLDCDIYCFYSRYNKKYEIEKLK